jgi:pimeloyl-ACP methyl ester carboxylesterase
VRLRWSTWAIDTDDGWTLHVQRIHRAGSAGMPLLLVPGFGMNGRAFLHHPRDHALGPSLARGGHDVWIVDPRGTSTSRGHGPVHLADLARRDLPAVVATMQRTTGTSSYDAVGCSLGGTLLLTARVHGALAPRSIATLGTPLVWVERPKLVAAFAALEAAWPHVPLRGSRAAAGWALPIVRTVAPDLLSFYLNPRVTDLSRAAGWLASIEDPAPHLAAALAAWIRARRLVVDGIDVAEALATDTTPRWVAWAREDGLVPASVAQSARVGPHTVGYEVTSPAGALRHVDLFLANDVHAQLIEPLLAWLADGSMPST